MDEYFLCIHGHWLILILRKDLDDIENKPMAMHTKIVWLFVTSKILKITIYFQKLTFF